MSEASNESPYPLLPPGGKGQIENTRGVTGELPTEAMEKARAERDRDRAPQETPVRTSEAIDAVLVSDDEYAKIKVVNDETPEKKEEERKQGLPSEEIAALAAAAAAAQIAEALRQMREEEEKNKKQTKDAQEHFEEREKEIRESIGKRSFTEIQDELKLYISTLPPNKGREMELKRERAIPLRVAAPENKGGIGVLTGIKRHIDQIRTTLPFDEAYDEIQKIDVERFENEARTLFGWDDKLEGIIEEYKEVAILNMELAALKASRSLGIGDPDQTDEQIALFEREIDLRGWGSIPAGQEKWARDFFIAQQKEAQDGRRQATNADDLNNLTAVEYLRRLALSSEMQVELLSKGYDEVIAHLYNNTGIDPRQYKLNLPAWFKNLEHNEQNMLNFMMNVNYIANRKASKGTLEEVLGLKGELRMDSVDFQEMWENLPGFKEALTTMISDLFDENAEQFVLTDSGLTLLKNEDTFKKYKDDMATRISPLVAASGEDFLNKMRVTDIEQANAAVATAYNLLFAGGAFDSGDTTGKLSLGAPKLVSPGFRFFYMPKLRGTQKWIQPGKTSENFGGPIGKHIRWNIENTRGYKRRFDQGKINLLPGRLLYSLFDHETFNKVEDGVDPRFAGKSFAKVLLDISRASRTYTNDIKDPSQIDVNFADIDSGGDMLGSYVENVVGYALPVYNHLTSGDKEKTLSMGGLVDLIVKMRKDPLMRPGTQNEDFIIACVAMALSPEKGILEKTPELLLDIPESGYDAAAKSAATTDYRLFIGMPRRTKRNLVARLHGIYSPWRKRIATTLGLFGKTRERDAIRFRALKNAE